VTPDYDDTSFPFLEYILLVFSMRVGVFDFGGELQAGQGLRHVRLERAHHNEHESLGVSTQGDRKATGACS
jgi:hypothetical protein